MASWSKATSPSSRSPAKLMVVVAKEAEWAATVDEGMDCVGEVDDDGNGDGKMCAGVDVDDARSENETPTVSK